MNRSKGYIFTLIILLATSAAFAQVKVSGRIFDVTKQKTLEAVSVLSNNGGGTMTDEKGKYTIIVDENDSIWFSYLGKPTPKFAVAKIVNIQNFELALHVNIMDLKQVVVMPKSYRRDSIQNRLDYAKAFNFQRPNLSTLTSIGPNGVGLDIDEFIRLFQFRKNRRMEAFQDRLLREEMEAFIDHRFSRALIIKITGLRGAELDTFIRIYRPKVEFIETASEYELQAYIKKSYLQYMRYKSLFGEFRKPEQE